MTTADWALPVAFVAHGAAIKAALVKLVAWCTTKVAVIENRFGSLERAAHNDINYLHVRSQIVNDVTLSKIEIEVIRKGVDLPECQPTFCTRRPQLYWQIRSTNVACWPML